MEPGTWEAALRLVASALPADAPSVVVIDELPYLTRGDASFEGTLQKIFDRVLSRLPVLLVAVGSDLAMMEAPNAYGRPFHQRAREMVVPALTPPEAGEMVGASAAAAIDAWLVTGGLPHLRFWLAFLGPHLHEIERGRSDRVLARVRRSWTSWRGRAVEPVVRDGLERLPPEERAGTDGIVGGWWTRTDDPEIDLVVADRQPVASRVEAVGSITWLGSAPFDDHDLARLVAHRDQLPGAGAGTPLLVVSRSGCTAAGVHAIDPETLLGAWRTRRPSP